jgi:hypothetical protein
LRIKYDTFDMSKLKEVDDLMDERVHFGASFTRRTLSEVDERRGDTNRSLWLERLAIKELGRLKKLQGVVGGKE